VTVPWTALFDNFMAHKLTAEQMDQANMVLEEMGTDPDAIAFELVWRRHNKAPDQNTQILGEIAMAIADDVPKEICLTVDGVRWLRDRYRDGQKALRELEKIRTEKVLCKTCGADEANAISKARHYLSNAEMSHTRKPEEKL
jgi:hypothetical protein